MIDARVSVRTTGIHGNLWIIGSVEMANERTVNSMTDAEVIICLVSLAVTVIPMSLWYVVTMSRDIDMVIKRCESLKRWAKRNLDERDGDHHEG